jgi:hypothetical protein
MKGEVNRVCVLAQLGFLNHPNLQREAKREEED